MEPLVGSALTKLGASKGLQTGAQLGMRGLGAAGRMYEPPGAGQPVSLPWSPQPRQGQSRGLGSVFERKIRRSLFAPHYDIDVGELE